MLRNVLTLILSVFIIGSFAAKGTEIKITIKDLAGTKMILANYFGEKNYIKDTFEFDKSGVCHIKMDTLLPGGIYLAVLPKMNNKYFEFIVNEPKIYLSTDSADLAGKMKIELSGENKVFYDDMNYLAEKRKVVDKVNADLKTAKDEAEKEKLKDEMKKIDEEVKAKRKSIEETNPTFLYSKLLRAMREIDIPKDGPRDKNGVLQDSSWQWRHYKDHYWDNIDLKDDRLIRTPIFHGKFSQFYNRILVQQPDSLIKESDIFIAKLDPKSEIFKYVLVYMLNEMAKSKIMGFDAVYTHLVNNYYAKGYATWVDSAQLYKINERGRILEPLLIGKKAQNINLADSTLTKYISFYELKNRFVILAFWDPDCGHCKKEIPKLAEVYHKMKKDGIDVEVYAPGIFDIAEMNKWLEFIKEKGLDWINVCDPYHKNNFRFQWDLQSTPQLYILDKDKKIIAKRIGVDNIEDFIKHEIDPTFVPKNKTIIEDRKEDEDKEH